VEVIAGGAICFLIVGPMNLPTNVGWAAPAKRFDIAKPIAILGGHSPSCLLALLACCLLSGCALIPDISEQPQYHNPFPQLSRVAVLPFNNLSDEPTLDQ